MPINHLTRIKANFQSFNQTVFGQRGAIADRFRSCGSVFRRFSRLRLRVPWTFASISVDAATSIASFAALPTISELSLPLSHSSSLQVHVGQGYDEVTYTLPGEESGDEDGDDNSVTAASLEWDGTRVRYSSVIYTVLT